MKKCLLILLILGYLCPLLKAQTTETKPPLFGISFSGYVQTDIFFDSRQTINMREGHFLLYPENKKPDAEGNDINAKAAYNILSIQSRLAGTITGPDALGAKTSGYIEAEFFGNSNPNINTFRLRHAYVKLNWAKTELMVGQYWHPMFVASCAPDPVSFNTGAPFVVFSRNPQVRLTQTMGKFKFILTALSQLDFTSSGPDGASPKYLRNSVLPEVDFQVQYGIKNEKKGTEFLVGAGIDYMVLTPLLSTDVTLKKASDTVVNNIVIHQSAVTATYITHQTVPAVAANIFAKLRIPKFTFKIGGFWGQDMYSFTMLGGYVVKGVTNAEKGTVNYANIPILSGWCDIVTNGKKWQFGILGCYSKNLGAGVKVTGPYYGRGCDIDYLYRISPRVVLNVNKFRFAPELEYTVAGYGKTNEKGYVSNPSEVGNLRLLLGVFYYF
jgi:hypothetical protein